MARPWHVSTSARRHAEAQLIAAITAIHRMSRGSYGSPQVQAELALDQGQGRARPCSRKRVARLMQAAWLNGAYRRRPSRLDGPRPRCQPAPRLREVPVNDQPEPAVADQLRLTDIERHEAPLNPDEAGGILRRSVTSHGHHLP